MKLLSSILILLLSALMFSSCSQGTQTPEERLQAVLDDSIEEIDNSVIICQRI